MTSSGALTEAQAEAALLEELASLSSHFDKGSEAYAADSATVTAVRLCTLYPQLPQELSSNAAEQLQAAVPLLTEIMRHATFPALQHNACAALAGALVVDKGCVELALAAGLPAQALEILEETSEIDFKRNLVVLLGTVAESSYEGLHDFLVAGAMQAILKEGEADAAGEIEQDVCDTVCKVATDPDSRKELVDMGAVSFMGRTLQSSNPEARDRSLLALVMLLEGNDEAQEELMRVEGVASALFGIVRESGSDRECKFLAQSLITELSKKDGLKMALLHQLRTSSSQS
mmetsp:Transcript_34645/g.98165  ORF Transcript_34645/g.98165 Transcript_34645/m.98165 type:complete len:289 (-) Transcript_34645:539-1405(-)